MNSRFRRKVGLALAGFFVVGGAAADRTVGADPKKPGAAFSLPGRMVLARVVSVTPAVPGRVTKVLAADGDVVLAGQLLAELDATQTRLHMALAMVGVELARARYQAAHAGLSDKQRQQSPGKERLAIAAAEIKLAEARLRLAKHAVDGTQIRAPERGTIVVRRVRVGDIVGTRPSGNPGSSLFELADVRRLEVLVDVDEAHANQVFRGQPCDVDVPAVQKDKYRGKVVRLSPVIDPGKRTRRVCVAIDLPAKEQRLRPGMFTVITFLPKE